MKRIVFIVVVLTSLLFALPVSADKASRETINSGGKSRIYYLFVPDNLKPSAPLMIALHGSGRDGTSLIQQWREVASKEGFILVAPDANNSQGWSTGVDGPDFIHDVVEAVKTKYSVNPRKVYLFGHSAGAVFALYMGMLESEYFAAVAIHAGAWRDQSEFGFMEEAKRKLPISITVGDKDQFFPLHDVNATTEALKKAGFSVDLTVIKGHDHNYYGIASKINPGIWAFLSKQQLDSDPKYQSYSAR
ncbi:MAG TPA: alpha/beta hydrolase-fold protein [Blastocatellia bacterium]|nr:alpha/beta hydrolase-fold protein [Blastocatellia bacterium]